MLIWIIPLIALLVALAWIGTRPMKVPRMPEKEHPEDDAATIAYNSIGNWLIFKFERWMILKVLKKIHPTGILVDAGCGPGYLIADITKTFPSLEVIGLDLNEKTITIAKHNQVKSQLNFIVGNIQKLPFESNSLDIVTTSLSLHHWANGQEGLEELYRILKSDGRLILFDLRRDAWKAFYYAMIIGQLFAPCPIRRTNGAVGSFWSSYTMGELQLLIKANRWKGAKTKKNIGWILIQTGK